MSRAFDEEHAGERSDRRRRWPWVLFGIVLVLALLVALAPVLARPLVERALVGALERELDAEASIEELSLSHGGTLRLEGLALADASGPLAEVDSLEASAGLLALLRGAFEGSLVVDGFLVHARVDEEGRWNWSEAARRGRERSGREAPEHERDEDEPGQAPDVAARIEARNGRIVLSGPQGGAELRDLSFEATVDGLERAAPLALHARLVEAGGEGAGTLDLDGTVTLAGADGRLDARGVRGELTLAVEGVRLDALEPVLTAALPLESLAGRLDGRADLALEEGFALVGTGEGTLAELVLGGTRAGAAPVTIETTRLAFSGERGAAGATTQRLTLSSDGLLELRWDGTTTRAPGGTAGVEDGAPDAGRLEGTLGLEGDVGRLAEVAAAWAPLERGLRLDGRLLGSARLSAALEGGAPERFALDASLSVEGLAARDAQGRPVDLGELAASRLAIALEADLAAGSLAWSGLDAALGPVVLQGAGSVTGLGAAQALALGESRLSFAADLERLGATLAPVLELGELRMRGRIDGELTARADATAGPDAPGGTIEATEIGGRLDVADLFVAREADAPALEIGAVEARLAGSHEPAAGRLALRELRWTSDFLRLAAQGELTREAPEPEEPADPTGPSGPTGPSAPSVISRYAVDLTGTLELDPPRLGATLGALLGTTRLEGAPLAGSFALRGTAPDLELRLDAASEGVRVVRAAEPGAEARTITLDQLALEADVALGAGGTAELRQARLRTASLSAAASGRWAGPRSADTALELSLAGELQPILLDLGLERPTPGRSLEGTLDVRTQVTGAAEALSLEGAAEVRELRLTTTAEGAARPFTLHEPALRLSWQARATLPEEAPGAPSAPRAPSANGEASAHPAAAPIELAFERLELDAQLARGQASGRIALPPAPEDSGERALVLDDVRGELTYVPERVGALLAPWLPGELSGAEEERIVFALSGSTDELDWAHVLAGTEGRASVALGRFRTAGLDTQGDLELELDGGRTSFDGAWQANGGQLALAGVLDLAEEREPAAAQPAAAGGAAPAPSHVTLRMDQVRATSGLAALLSFVHPAFAAAEEAEGGRLEGVIDADLRLSYAAPLAPEALEGGWAGLPKGPFEGGGTFAIHGLRLAGSPLLGEMLAELGVDPQEGYDLRPLEFRVEQGRLSYVNPWTWTLGGTETTFTGSVGLDRTLDLAWNVPVSAGLVERYGFLESLQGQTLSIPIGGTVKRPQLAWEDALADLAQRFATTELTERLGLGGVLGGGGDDDGEEGGEQGGGAKDDPAALLEQAQELWDAGEKAEAARIYQRLREEFKLSLVYLLNRDEIKDRAKWKPK